jgi:glycosyltransferase involved in cell wall biosynthesis
MARLYPCEVAVVIDRVSSNAELAKEKGAKGRRLANQKHSWDKIARDTIDICNEAINFG